MRSDQTSPPSSTTESPGIAWVVILRFFVMALLLMAVLFLAAGKLDWWEGWAYVIQAFFVIVFSRAILILKNPDLARERAEAGKKENVKPWDRILMPTMSVFLPVVSLIVCGLDERFGWSSDLPDGIQLVALFLMFAGSMLGTWAMIANRFFSSQVRIQTERGHRVVSSGPYRVVRHPAYAGGVLSWIVSPVFFSSTWAAIPAILAIVVIITRTALEDRTLQAELPGYLDYARIVRFRLVPRIW
ncbi:MAG: isoprenylcysteine carboxylmethyltransferase family protein [Candidatus Aminicenantes bacterium]|nr:isoprenylcysteine carboxylmethyltransferase family protein [Candidatus Aminicenantes bacterium]